MNQICKIGIKKFLLLIKKKKISYLETVKICLNNIKKNKKFTNEIFEKESIKIANKLDNNKDKEIYSFPVSIKDIYCIKKKKCTCNSKILKNFIPKYNSKIIKILKKNNLIILSSDTLEEFCVGGSGYKNQNNNLMNLFNNKYFIGGSSVGSALNVSYGGVFAAIASDTGGSVRTPAALNNLVGFKPTYGKISRFGMITYSSYLDTCSLICNSSEDIFFVYKLLLKNNDISSYTKKKNIIKNFFIKIGILFFNLNIDIENKILFEKIIKNLELIGYVVDYIKFNYNDFIFFYEILSSKDFYSNTCKFDGIKYGYYKNKFKNKNDFVKNNRIFSVINKNKIKNGINSYIHFNNEKKFIKNMYIYIKKIFCNFDLLLLPTNINNFKKKEEKYINYLDIFTTFSNLLGLPSINISLGFKNHIPLGFQIISDFGNDEIVLNTAIKYEKYFIKKYVAI